MIVVKSSLVTAVLQTQTVLQPSTLAASSHVCVCACAMCYVLCAMCYVLVREVVIFAFAMRMCITVMYIGPTPYVPGIVTATDSEWLARLRQVVIFAFAISKHAHAIFIYEITPTR